jgi:adenosylmethionine-8-amino-7-oxononanoate aminotransferase
MRPIETLNHLHTYGNHPVPCAVANRNIELLEEEQLVGRSADIGAYFLEGLRSLEVHPTVGETRGTGLWLAIDFTLDKQTREPYPSGSILSLIAKAKSKGLIIKTMGSALEFAPPLIIERTDIDWAIGILDQCITEEEQTLGLVR